MTECKSLIARMLVTEPSQRASLAEIMHHPWMTKGFGGPPENYLPIREPLSLPLDSSIIDMMTGFDFGPPETITAQLTEILASGEYKQAVKAAARDREAFQPRDDKRRGFGFDFYKRRNSTTSRDTLSAPSTDALHVGNDPVNAFHPLISVYYLCLEKAERDRVVENPGATSMPRTPNEAPLQIAEPVPPKPAYTNSATYEMPGEKATGGRSRPRARTHGEDEVAEGMKNVKLGPPSPAAPEPSETRTSELKKEGTAASILRRFSTRKRKEPERTDRGDRYYPPVVKVQSAATEEPPHQAGLRKSFSVRRTRETSRDREPGSMLRSGSSQPRQRELLTPPQSGENSRTAKGLGRSTSVNSADFRRRNNEEGSVPRPPRVSYKDAEANDSDRSNGNDQKTLLNEQKSLAYEKPRDTDGKPSLNARAATTRAKSLGHARRESIQARRARREEAREANLPEETDQDADNNDQTSSEKFDAADNVKPVFLKGLFSVSTTSTKPVAQIRDNIMKVLGDLSVEYTEVRGGFHCKHIPSIDLKKVQDIPPMSRDAQTPGHRRRISFGGFNIGGSSERDRDDFRDSQKSPRTPKTPGRSGHDTSYTNSDASEESVGRAQGGSSRRAVGETSTHVHSDLGGSMKLEFEIFIVKIPLLSLHGVQFKRLSGGTWQYKNMADQILSSLRL